MERLEPWGEKRADYRAARIIEAVYQSQGAKTEFQEILKRFDFEPKISDEDRDAEVLEAAVKMNRKS